MKHLIPTFVCFSLLLPIGSAFAKNDKQKKHKSLPPGLQKKHQRGQPLPPGWQKKLHVGSVLDIDIYHHAKIIKSVGVHGHITVSIEGHILRIVKDTRKIVEIIKRH